VERRRPRKSRRWCLTAKARSGYRGRPRRAPRTLRLWLLEVASPRPVRLRYRLAGHASAAASACMTLAESSEAGPSAIWSSSGSPWDGLSKAGRSRAASGRSPEREKRGRKAYVAREQFRTCGDKAVRAQSFRGLIAVRGLRVPAHAPWRAEFESELLRFPAGVHDDQVDACGLDPRASCRPLRNVTGISRSSPTAPKSAC